MPIDDVTTQVAHILAALDAKGFNTSQTMELSGGDSIQPLKEFVKAVVTEIRTQITVNAKAIDTGTDGAEAGNWPIQ